MEHCDRFKRYSKLLSHLLRHSAVKQGLHIQEDGYVLLDEILSRHDFTAHGIDLKFITQLVKENNKQRFELTELNGKHYIRASQGHSMKEVDSEKILQPIVDPSQYTIVVHGTFSRFWSLIRSEGLKPMRRNHVHFATGYPGKGCVISGMRPTCDVYIELNMSRAMADGMKFYISANKVILTSGLDNVIEPKYFKQVFGKNGERLL